MTARSKSTIILEFLIDQTTKKEAFALNASFFGHSSSRLSTNIASANKTSW